MTDIPTDTVTESDVDSAVITELRQQAKEGKAAKAEADALRREMAFDRAGVPTEGPASYFRKAYEGEITPDAIRAEAEAAGLLAPPAPEVPDGEVAAATSIGNAMTGGTPPQPPDLNAQLREVGKDGFGDQAQLDAAILALNLQSEDFDRIAQRPYG